MIRWSWSACLLLAAGYLLFAGGCGDKRPAADSNDELDLPDKVVFNEHIRPILAANCAACHGGVMKSGGLSFVFEDEAIAVGQSGNASIVPGDPAASFLLDKITSDDPLVRMPPPDHGPALSDRQVGLIERWIAQGAGWEEHWAFVKPTPVKVPRLADDAWSRNDIDRFVLRKLREKDLQPSPEASRGALLRRATLDLTGLPPTVEELDAFIADDSDDAYDKVVDRLLASPRFGERWATMWLDLARYADSKGLGQDRRRPTMYMYRDWVIRAFNRDMPFDEFTIKQIAGDLLPNATLDDYLATAFHRNSPAEDEGGTDDEEFRIVSIMDRVNTTWQVWHATTMSCVQCHSHPYDPIRHEDYFKFMDFLNNVQDGDLTSEQPNLAFPSDAYRIEALGTTISEERDATRRLWEIPAGLAERSAWVWLGGLETSTDKDDQLSYRIEERAGREEFVFEGTPTPLAQTITAPLPDGYGPIQAMRMEVMPELLEAAPYEPSTGFILKKLKATLVGPDGTKRPLAFDRIDLDEPFPMTWPNPKEGSGFAALNYMSHTRWAVFRFAEPFVAGPGDTLLLEMNHGQGGPKGLLLIKRGAIALTDEPGWRDLGTGEAYRELVATRQALRNELKQGEQVRVPVMVERPEHLRRGTKTFVRGNWTDLGEPQQAGVPDSFHPLPDTDEPARLRMARWLADKDNPLAARVLVCRFWEQLFGTGIVETLEDFGTVGLPPSHPDLLDHLALKLMHDFDWSMKDLLRYIVTSATYRQDSTSSPALNEIDPDNRLFARGPRTRLTGEMVRDQVLAVAGVLNEEMFGPPVMPPLPEGGWNPSHPQGGKWVQSDELASNRRSIYVHWQRSSPYPIFTAFDAPSRDLVSDRRINSNTPVQPLFTLNDPALFNATVQFAERMHSQPGSIEERIAYGYRLATSEPASPIAVERLKQLYDGAVDGYPAIESLLRDRWDAQVKAEYDRKRQRQEAKNRQAINQAKRNKKDPPTDLPDPNLIQPGPDDAYEHDAEMAGLVSVASVILNLDAALNK